MHLEYIHRVCLDSSPNIEGELFRNNNYGSSQFLADATTDELQATGAFNIIVGSNETIPNGTSFSGAKGFSIDASKSSSVYSGSSIQVNALQCLMCIKF